MTRFWRNRGSTSRRIEKVDEVKEDAPATVVPPEEDRQVEDEKEDVKVEVVEDRLPEEEKVKERRKDHVTEST